MSYNDFLRRKVIRHEPSGFEAGEINDKLFDWQGELVKWALRKGKAAIFADCGLGKTFMQLEWACKVHEKTGGKVLIIAPLAVSLQTKREAFKLGEEVNICRRQNDVKDGVNITNYEMLGHFCASDFAGVVLDESSILKSFSGSIKNQLIDMFSNTPYKLACTATPSPNDFMELGNHSEFLNVMTRSEMLSTYFVHDGRDTAKWRLKGHAEPEFWRWIASWAAVVKNPADLGFNGEGFVLPELRTIEHIVDSLPDEGRLFASYAQTLTERRSARNVSMPDRIQKTAEIVNGSDEIHLVWCDYNNESVGLTAAIKDAVEITGSDKPEWKESAIIDFADGKTKCLVSKPRIAGFGMNLQICSNMVFCGLSDSYEQFYQAVRRCWRFGQHKPVTVHIIISEKERLVLDNIRRKEAEADRMSMEMVELTSEILKSEIGSVSYSKEKYQPEISMRIPDWLMAGGF